MNHQHERWSTSRDGHKRRFMKYPGRDYTCHAA
jgi:hypothetical protein